MGQGQALYYLTLDDVLEIYAAIFHTDVQTARDSLRDVGGLESALARPKNHASYRGADIATQAAVLAHGIAETQPFVEGNKRTALAAVDTFLEANGHMLGGDQPERARWIIDLAEVGVDADLKVDRLAAALREVISGPE